MNLLSGGWGILLENGTVLRPIAGFYCWQSGNLAVALARSALVSESPFKTSIPTAVAILSVVPLGKDSGDWG